MTTRIHPFISNSSLHLTPFATCVHRNGFIVFLNRHHGILINAGTWASRFCLRVSGFGIVVTWRRHIIYWKLILASKNSAVVNVSTKWLKMTIVDLRRRIFLSFLRYVGIVIPRRWGLVQNAILWDIGLVGSGSGRIWSLENVGASDCHFLGKIAKWSVRVVLAGFRHVWNNLLRSRFFWRTDRLRLGLSEICSSIWIVETGRRISIGLEFILALPCHSALVILAEGC